MKKNEVNQLLPDDLKNNDQAMDIMDKLIDLIDLINDPNVNTEQNNIGERLRAQAIHMLKANI